MEFKVIHQSNDVALRLFAFPHAGGGRDSFAAWRDGLPQDVEIVSYSLPGRGTARGEQPYLSWNSLIDDLTELVSGHQDGTPFAFFGHSFGALVAFEVSRRLGDENKPTPQMLFLSAHRAPHLSTGRSIHSLTDGKLIEFVRHWGLVPAELLADADLLRFVLPPLRADLLLDEEYESKTGPGTANRLNIPTVVFGGESDPTVGENELIDWREHFAADAEFEIEMFVGGHFFTVESQAELLDSIARHLDRAREAIGKSIERGAEVPSSSSELSLWQRFAAQVVAEPSAPALADGPRRWSYQDLLDDANALATHLISLGVSRGDVVGLLLPHSAEYCIGLMTCFALGAPACLLEKNWPADLLREFLDNAGVRVVVTTAELAETLPLEFRTPSRHLVLDQDYWAQHRLDGLDPPQLPDVRPTDIALISMTSGTSGIPKAVLNSHQSCLYCFDARYRLYPYNESSRDGLNVFFAWECLRPLLVGRSATVVSDDDILDPIRLVGTLEESRVTRITVTPSLLESVLDHPTVGSTLISRLQQMEIVFLMGEVVSTRLVEKAAAKLAPHVALVNAYSTWESLDIAYGHLLPRATELPSSSTVAPVGRVLDGNSAILLNEHGKAVPYGGVGELYVAGPGVAVGYLGDPVKTSERFVPCPAELVGFVPPGTLCYRTGDRARFLSGGRLEILGRAGDVVKIRGFKVSLQAVERVLSSEEGIERALVRPFIDSSTGQPIGLTAYLLGDSVMPSETVLTRARLTARRQLPHYARPLHYIGLAELPLSGGDSRKVDLTALPSPETERAAGLLDQRPTTMEQRIAQLWREVLGVETPDADDNFFEIGGNSLSAARLAGLLGERYGISLAVVDVFQYSTLRDLAARCANSSDEAAEPTWGNQRRSVIREATKLAVVGIAGRFPGAGDVDAFWQNLMAGVDSLTTFPLEVLRRKGVPDNVLSDPKWVPVGQILADADKFDANFWGIGQREAVLMDPQHRVFIEVAWQALEQAGYARKDNPYRRRTGVYASCGIDGYLIHHLEGAGLKDLSDPGGIFLTEIGNEKDYIATRVAYLLDLGGPAITVTSACSSALVAVAQAAQALMNGQCDMAIAGGAAINFPNFGYRYEDGLVGSQDGRVRPFDSAASGTLFGDAVGAVVLKRLDDALADNDHIWSLLTGFGLSNDGRMKAGYTAPSARAQTQCISDAIEMAQIGSEQISYVECHATATHVGDAIELRGLFDAFGMHRRTEVEHPGQCAIGSVKGNIGHANCAAGITGLIKTILCLHHRTLVPTVNYATLNPKLVDFVDQDSSPFTIQQTCAPWTVVDPGRQMPRRAGVSSFGIGGTNAHVILEEAPPVSSPSRPDMPGGGEKAPTIHLVTLSARSESALIRNGRNLVQLLGSLDEEGIAAAVRSLHRDRYLHHLRTSAVLIPPLTTEGSEQLNIRFGQPVDVVSGDASVAFCFSGQGSQAAGMARGLYRGRADGGRFRSYFEAACAAIAPHVDEDPLAQILGADDESVKRPLITQCGLFAVEYALAHAFADLRVRPVAVAGHSIGEYAAAELAGLLTLSEAAELVAVRAQATEALRAETADGHPGGMLSVVGQVDRLTPWLAARGDLWLAADNGPGRIVLSGSMIALRHANRELTELGFTCRAVPVSHPFHSPIMAPVAEALAAVACSLERRLPQLPIASNLTGSWFEAAYEPGTYWSDHVVSTVRWRDCLDLLRNWEPDLIVEIGPGDVLTTLAKKQLPQRSNTVAVATMPNSRNPLGDDEVDLLDAIGTLWRHGVPVDCGKLQDGAGAVVPRRNLLPAYSFDRTSYWTRPQASIYVGAELPGASGEKSDSTFRSEWLTRFEERPEAILKLYCFPYAGGGHGVFRSWAQRAPRWVEVIAVEPPGRDGRDDIAVMEELGAAIRSDAGSAGVAFCGLSFGATVALDLLNGPLASWAQQRKLTAVCLAGRAPIDPDNAPNLIPLDSYLVVPDELREDERWRREILPILKTDLAFDARSAERIAERRKIDGGPLIGTPLQVHCGTADPSFPEEVAADWSAITSSPIVDVHLHKGGHEFLLHDLDRILDYFLGFADRLLFPDMPEHDDARRLLYDVRWTPIARAEQPSPRELIPWIDIDQGEPAAAMQFLREHLTRPDSKAALCLRLGDQLAPAAYCTMFLELLRSAAESELRGHLIAILPSGATSGMFAGMSRSFVQEEPGLTVQRIDVHDWPNHSDGEWSDWVDNLLLQLESLPREFDVLYRAGHLLGRRLHRVEMAPLPHGTLSRARGSYLVTGGTGGIGRIVIDWLVHNQCVEPAQVIVLSRSAPRPRLRDGVRHVVLDLSGPVDPVGLAEQIGPLAGIIHLAGVLDDGVIRNLHADRLLPVLGSKLSLPVLQELGRVAGAPWIIAFSSTSALLGAPGQSNYAAANGWLDGFTASAVDGEGPALASINWGTWTNVGMAAAVNVGSASQEGGESPLDPGKAISLLGRIIAACLSGDPAHRQYAICDVDWDASPWAGNPLLCNLGVPTRTTPTRNPEHSSQLHVEPSHDDSDSVRTFLAGYVARWDDSQTLSDLGLDSLDFARMRGEFFRQFGKEVPFSAVARPEQRLAELHELLNDLHRAT